MCKIKAILIFILLFIFISNTYSQRQFQKIFGIDFSILNVNGIQHKPGQTIVSFCPGFCFDNDKTSHCTNGGFMIFNSYDSLVSSIQLHEANYDTSYYFQDFKILSNGNILSCGRLQKDTTYYSSILKIDSTFSFISGKNLHYSGINSFTKIRSKAGENNYYMLGYIDSIFSLNSQAVLFCRIDSTLSPIWSKSYNTLKRFELKDFDFLNDGNIISCGNISDSGSSFSNIFLMKIDTSGNIIWSKQYYSNRFALAYNIKPLNDGFMLCGTAWDSIYNESATFLMKLDNSGNILWIRKYIFDAGAQNGMIQTSDDGFLISSQYPNAGAGACLIRTDSIGNVLWNYYYENAYWNFYHSENEKHEFYSVGLSRYITTFPNDSIYIFMVKTDTLGNSGCLETSFPIAISTDNNLIVTPLMVYSADYMPNVSSFQLVRDTLHLNELVRCDGFTEVNETETKNQDINIYPNPTSGNLNVSFKTNTPNRVKIIITDLSGKIIGQLSNFCHAGNNSFDLDLSHISNGIYFLSIEAVDKALKSKFIKQSN